MFQTDRRSRIFASFGISELHIPLFAVYTLGVSIQILLMTLMTYFFYFDQRGIILALIFLQLITNALGTLLSQWFGFQYFGWGFALSVIFSFLV